MKTKEESFAPVYAQVVIKMSQKAFEALCDVQKTGLYGFTVEETAERIICRDLEHRIGLERFWESSTQQV